MSFVNFFNKKHADSIVLIDIGANSVAGAYVRYTPGEQPVIIHTRRLPVEVRSGEPKGQAMIRALKVLGDDLMHDGAPVLVHESGSGKIDGILVAIDAPWQKTMVHTEQFEQNMPFTFTQHLVSAALEKSKVVPEGQIVADESIIGTILNGYETRNPYGKLAHRASVSMLMSYVDASISKDILSVLKNLYHTKNITFITGSSLRYQAMRTVFPHERDALFLDTIGLLTFIALVRRGLLADIVETGIVRATHFAAWLKEVTAEFEKLAERFPLPRTIFLLAHEQDASSFKDALDKTNFSTLWLSDNPPKIVSILGSHMSGLVRQTTSTPPDLSLLLMALYYQHHKAEDTL